MVFLTMVATHFVVFEHPPQQPDLLKITSPSKGNLKPSHMNVLSFPLLSLKISMCLLCLDLALFHGFPGNLLTLELQAGFNQAFSRRWGSLRPSKRQPTTPCCPASCLVHLLQMSKPVSATSPSAVFRVLFLLWRLSPSSQAWEGFQPGYKGKSSLFPSVSGTSYR